jgi:cobalt/nickel transport system permease protein
VATGLAACGLLLQALFFAHGGISTLGANTLTLGVMGAGSGWLTFRLARKAGLSLGISAGLAGFVGDVMTYVLNIVILGLHFAYVAPHPQYNFWGYAGALASAYLPVQGPLAIFEAIFTGIAIQAIGKQRPEVLEELGVFGKKTAVAVALFLVFLLAAPAAQLHAAVSSTVTAASAPVLQPVAKATYSALDDLTDGMAAAAGTPSHAPWIDLEGYHDIWSSMCMFAGLFVGFILGRRWHYLFDKPEAAKAGSGKA